MYERTYHTKVLAQKNTSEPPRRTFFGKKIIVGITILLFLVGIILLIRLPSLQVKTIVVEGLNVEDPEEVETLAWTHLEGRLFSLLPRTSMFLVPSARIEKQIAATFPRFSSVGVHRSGFDSLVVRAVEREGVLLWCVSDDRCFFMDADGVVFAPAPFFSGDAYVKLFVGTESELPFTPVPSQMLATIALLRERLPSIGIEPVEFRERSEYHLDIVFMHNGVRVLLMIDPSKHIESMLEDLATGLSTEPLKARFRSSNDKLSYLDVRFANKVVYKFEE